MWNIWWYTRKIGKRFIPTIITIGIGLAAGALSVVNLFQIMNLKAEVRNIKESLQAVHLATLDNQAQIFHLREDQLKIVNELAETQKALNNTIKTVNQHAEILELHAQTLRALVSQTIILRDKSAAATQAIESHFIHESIENILSSDDSKSILHLKQFEMHHVTE